MYVPHKIRKICLAYKSKYNLTRKNQLILLMITDGEKWHYLAVKSLSALLNGITSNHNRDFYCLNFFRAKTFSVPVKKEIKNKNKIIEITYKIKFIDSCRFTSTSLSKLVDNLSEGLHNNRCVDCKSCLDYMKNKDEKLIFRCFNCKKNYEKDFNKEFIKRFVNTYNFCNNDPNKFILLLRKGVCPYDYVDN